MKYHSFPFNEGESGKYTGGSKRDADETEISIYLYVSEWGKKEMESK